jgi:hypothetical protein
MPDPRFPLIMVSLHADDLIEQYTVDVGTHARAPRELANDTYSLMNDTRRKLYEYIDYLEALAGIHGTIVRRFH